MSQSCVGTVRYFAVNRGYGFIIPSAGGRDKFVHFSDIETTGFKKLNAGDKVTYELGEGFGKYKVQAKHVKVIAPAGTYSVDGN